MSANTFFVRWEKEINTCAKTRFSKLPDFDVNHCNIFGGLRLDRSLNSQNFYCNMFCRNIDVVSDACACSTGGDCKCVCAVIAAYALKCARSGVVIPWRSKGSFFPGQVITNGCEKCQCLNNSLICSTTLECKQPEKVLDELRPYSENIPYIEVVTLKPGAKLPKPATRIIGPTRRKPSTPSSRGLVLASTTPACSYWSNWINKAKPKKGRKHGEKEDTRPYIVKQTEGFCKQGFITSIECRDVETDQTIPLQMKKNLFAV
ncbi:TIL domain-containing protein [Trichonephila inaurata madagascariensis]|uniref:TIL domain-containing protein n=1 Tax=Trichonephila inaurata madagascariensis TaxID=2747483 RepID=A0A8X7BTF1_9ARAC|nr:TIL domain-containing protein [Trichonephila inaurata madagascariensis]